MSKHCATCRCATTITGQIAALLDSDPSRPRASYQIAFAVGYVGGLENLRSTLDRMVRQAKIRRVGKRYQSILKEQISGFKNGATVMSETPWTPPAGWQVGGANVVAMGRDGSLCPSSSDVLCTIEDRDHQHTLVSSRMNALHIAGATDYDDLKKRVEEDRAILASICEALGTEYINGLAANVAALVRERADALKRAEEAERTLAEERKAWTFVPDDVGGHMRTLRGDKWYPESYVEKRISDLQSRELTDASAKEAIAPFPILLHWKNEILRAILSARGSRS